MIQRKFRSGLATIFPGLLALLVLLPACDSSETVTPAPEVTSGRYVFGVDAANNLVVFGATKPGVQVRRMPISGLQSGETIIGIDFNAKNGLLYAASSGSRIYTIDTTSAAASIISPSAITPAFSGTSFGFDFNPVPDRIRLHSDADQNLRINQQTGLIAAIDTVLVYMTGDANAGTSPTITGTAYTNSVAAPTSTVLFGIDSERDILVKLPAPNGGMISTVGPLGVTTTSAVGLDIAGNDGMAYAALSPNATGASIFYTINTTTGAATAVGSIFHASPLVGIAVQ